MTQFRQQRLADLEELILLIPNQLQQQYFNEAVQCYFIGALRAAVILGWVVATDNLLGKLELLSREDGEANKKWNSIEQKRKRDESFEEDLINSFGPGGLDIFGEREVDQLKYVRRIRNWCAHATGYQTTAEEVRNCLRLLVDIVLSTPVYRGYRYISQLEDSIKDSNFLPSRGYEAIVAEVLSKLRPALYSRVVSKLVDVTLDPAATQATLINRHYQGWCTLQMLRFMMENIDAPLPRYC